MKRLLANLLSGIDRRVRHQGVLGQHRWLRNLLRRPYHALINIHGTGIPVTLGGVIPARLPPEFSSLDMEAYEPEAFAQLAGWLADKVNPVVVDLGCSLGYLSCGALHAHPDAVVVAVDSDIQSLKSASRVCAYAPRFRDRFTPVFGYVSEGGDARASLAAVTQASWERLAAPGVTGDPGTHRYVNLDRSGANPDVPHHRLDVLLGGVRPGQPVLIKCDVEGAELGVLRSGERSLRALRPTILLSVHPPFLPKFGHTREQVEEYVRGLGYSVRVVSVDHEEHWLCEPGAPAAAPGSA